MGRLFGGLGGSKDDPKGPKRNTGYRVFCTYKAGPFKTELKESRIKIK